MKKVLILTSFRTGNGHRSAANAIEKKLSEKGFEVSQLDVFPLMGRMGRLMEDSYITLTTRAPFVYYLCQRVSELFPWFIHWQMFLRSKKLLQEIREYQPDVILSVQCMFTTAVSRLLRVNKLDIPFYIGVIDLVDPPKVWQDPKADQTFVPTRKIYDDYHKAGFNEESLTISGFPIRDDIISRKKETDKEFLRILMVNSSTDLRKNVRFVEELTHLNKIHIDYVCGLDERLREELNRLKEEKQLGDKITVHGYISNINELLAECDVILTKAGPNMIMEALYSGTPIIITGHIHGQEDRNYEFVVNNGFGLKCEDPQMIYDTLTDFVESRELQSCRKRILDYGISNGAEMISRYISEHADQADK